MLMNQQYEKPLPPPSLGLLEDDEGPLEARLAKECEVWLRSESPQPKAKEDDFNEFEWDISRWDATDIATALDDKGIEET